jgi:hypothetical protein
MLHRLSTPLMAKLTPDAMFFASEIHLTGGGYTLMFITKTPLEGILLLLADIISHITAARMMIRRIANNILYLLKTINIPYTPIIIILFLLLDH